ncbi:MAG TPA: glucoamylase family protein [Tepidisphaeraceae bacterium]|jgi:hypothetical protein|nr:glucoamylase family protein [Tepidisphaeraceae bacterium]
MTAEPFKLPALAELQRQTFAYFLHETNPRLGLVADKTEQAGPASIAAVGLALAGYPVGVERGFISRHEAVSRTLAAMRFFHTAPQGTQPDATGYKGFYYHFLDMHTGKRSGGCELSTIDTALLLAGMLAAAAYFDHEDAAEAEIRQSADELYRRADWDWARNGGATVSHGWSPESGFLPDRWEGYCEALVLYVLGLGSPTHPLPAESYEGWSSTYQWKNVLGYEYLYAGPLFVHQLSHLWIDLRGIQDKFMRSKGIDYFENSRRATYAQRQYAIENPREFIDYSDISWGITASEGPGPATLTIGGKRRHFFGYQSREIPDGPDDGTLAPWAVVASLPFAPEIVLPALQHFEDLNLREPHRYGFKATFNRTFPEKDRDRPFWVSPYHLGLNLGPMLLMIENAQSGLLWRLMRSCPCIIHGLSRAGFTGGWLDGK